MYSWSLSVSAVNAWRLRMQVKKPLEQKNNYFYFFENDVSYLLFCRSQATGSPSCRSWSWDCLRGMGCCPSGRGWAASPPKRPDTTALSTGLCQLSLTARAPPRGGTKQCPNAQQGREGQQDAPPLREEQCSLASPLLEEINFLPLIF